MIFWIDKVVIPDGYIFNDKDYIPFKQREYEKVSMEIEDAKTLFDNIVDNYLNNDLTSIIILQMTVQIGPNEAYGAIGARAVIDGTNNCYFKKKDIIKTFYDKNMEAAHEYTTKPEVQKARKVMEITVEFEWYTDGDYTIRDEELKQNFKSFPLQCLNSLTWSGNAHDMGSLTVIFESENREACLRSLRELLDRLSVSMSVSWTHKYLMKDLYDMFESINEQCCSLYDKKLSEPIYIYKGLSGNYAGTGVNIAISE